MNRNFVPTAGILLYKRVDKGGRKLWISRRFCIKGRCQSSHRFQYCGLPADITHILTSHRKVCYAGVIPKGCGFVVFIDGVCRVCLAWVLKRCTVPTDNGCLLSQRFRRSPCNRKHFLYGQQIISDSLSTKLKTNFGVCLGCVVMNKLCLKYDDNFHKRKKDTRRFTASSLGDNTF